MNDNLKNPNKINPIKSTRSIYFTKTVMKISFTPHTIFCQVHIQDKFTKVAM